MGAFPSAPPRTYKDVIRAWRRSTSARRQGLCSLLNPADISFGGKPVSFCMLCLSAYRGQLATGEAQSLLSLWRPYTHSSHFIPVVVQLLSRVQLFATPWTAAHQASLSCTISRSLLKLMSIKSVMLSNHLILCCPLLLLPSIFPSIRVFSNESALCISIGVSASASVLPMNIQD